MNLVYDDFESKIQNEIATRRLMGESEENIINSLNADLKNEQGIFKELSGRIQGDVDKSLYGVFQINSNDTIQGEADLWKRQLDPAAEHCDACIYEASQKPRPYDKVPLPGMQLNHGDTNCRSYCMCTIIPV
jgi:hypothetical protein